MSMWIKKNGKWVEVEESPTPSKRAVTPVPATRPKAIISPEVELFESIRDVHLALAEWRIAVALEKKSLPEKIAALRKELDSLESRINPSEASVAARLFIRRAVNGLKQVLA